MKLELYESVQSYLHDIMALLTEYETQNNLFVSICLKGKDGTDTSGWVMATVKDENAKPAIIAIMTPPFNLLLFERDNVPCPKGVTLLAQKLEVFGISVPGVMGEPSVADRFSKEYASLTGKKRNLTRNLRIYRLDRVNPLPKTGGKLRLSNHNDLFFMPYWYSAFAVDCHFKGIDIAEATDKIIQLTKSSSLYIWEDEIPVSQAAASRKTLNGSVINCVYTPPHYRGKGYATACVAALSQHLLDSGSKFCVLFADLANPISNSIYENRLQIRM